MMVTRKRGSALPAAAGNDVLSSPKPRMHSGSVPMTGKVRQPPDRWRPRALPTTAKCAPDNLLVKARLAHCLQFAPGEQSQIMRVGQAECDSNTRFNSLGTAGLTRLQVTVNGIPLLDPLTSRWRFPGIPPSRQRMQAVTVGCTLAASIPTAVATRPAVNPSAATARLERPHAVTKEGIGEYGHARPRSKTPSTRLKFGRLDNRFDRNARSLTPCWYRDSRQ